jgi:hypothetical protein
MYPHADLPGFELPTRTTPSVGLTVERRFAGQLLLAGATQIRIPTTRTSPEAWVGTGVGRWWEPRTGLGVAASVGPALGRADWERSSAWFGVEPSAVLLVTEPAFGLYCRGALRLTTTWPRHPAFGVGLELDSDVLLVPLVPALNDGAWARYLVDLPGSADGGATLTLTLSFSPEAASVED